MGLAQAGPNYGAATLLQKTSGQGERHTGSSRAPALAPALNYFVLNFIRITFCKLTYMLEGGDEVREMVAGTMRGGAC